MEVSIFCTAYNHEKYIRDTLEGFVSQKTDFEYEVLINDDASTDHTADIIREYEEKYPDIIKPIYQKENQYSKGKKISDNFLYPASTGKYICLCEGDDYWCDDHKLQKQYDFITAHPEYSAVVHNTEKLDCISGERSLLNACTEDKDVTVEEVLQSGNAQFHTSSLFYKRELFLRPPVFEGRGFEDYPRSIWLCLNGKVRYLKDVMSVYRVNTSGSWYRKNMNSRDHKKEVEHYKKVIAMLENIDKYTEGKYHTTIDRVVRKHTCSMLQADGRAKEIVKNYKDIYGSLSKKEQVIVLMQGYTPHLFDFLFSMKNRMKNRKGNK